MRATHTDKEFEELLKGNNNQPILVDTPSSFIAKQLIEKLVLDFNIVELNEYNDLESIKIDQIRDLVSLASSSVSARVNLIVIYNFENAGKEAQNAFLKSLEETTSGTRFIITTKQKSKLLSTVISRCIIFRMKLDKPASLLVRGQNLLDLSEADLGRMLISLNEDLDMTVESISSKESFEKYNQAMADAKMLIGRNLEPLASIDISNKDKAASLQMLAIALSITNHKMTNDLSNSSTWASVAKKLIKSKEYILQNVNHKAILDKLVLEL